MDIKDGWFRLLVLVVLLIFICLILPLLEKGWWASLTAKTDHLALFGLMTHASLQGIRETYEQSTKEWLVIGSAKLRQFYKSFHPNIAIKQAFELLSDSTRRKSYDFYGSTNADVYRAKEHPENKMYERCLDPFEQFFGLNFFGPRLGKKAENLDEMMMMMI